MIPLSVPHIEGNEWQYVKECIDTEWVSSAGKFVDRFEQDICKLTGASFAIACVNGTAALQVALEIVGVREGDEVLVPTMTFIAPVNAVRYNRAEPIFMDCDEFYCLDVQKAMEFIKSETFYKKSETYNKKSGKRISSIIPVHVFGNAVDLSPLLAFCRERNIKIVEDAAESLGTYYSQGSLKGKYTGTVGDIGCLSFNGNKIITTGGGGMIITNNPDFAARAKYLTTQAKDDEVRYIHHAIGYNFRLTNIQAALGVAQLEKLNLYMDIKKRNYHEYKRAIGHISGLRIADVPSYAAPNYWFYCLLIDKSVFGHDRDQLMNIFGAHKIQTRPVWHLNHLQKPYRHCQGYRIEKAIDLFDKTLNIPCSTSLTQEQINEVLKVLENANS